jgi:hypothetical protein
MATFADIKTRVSGRLLDPNNTAVSSADVAASINDTIRYWKSTEFWFNSKYADVTLTIEDGTIPLPDDFYCPATKNGGFQIEYSNQRYNLSKIEPTQYSAAWQDNGYGIPQSYARLGQSYEVLPLPDRAYTLKCLYLKEYADLVNDADTNDFTNNASRLITLWTCANLIAELRQDEKMESYFRQACMDELRQLQQMTGNLNSTGTLAIY